MERVVEALVELARGAGVEFAFDTKVERIETDGSRARGVVLADGRRLNRRKMMRAKLPEGV